MTSTVWEADGIRMGHTLSRFRERTRAAFSSPLGDVVRLHFGLRGDYRFTWHQAGRSFDLIGSHHNLLYSDGFDMDVENKTLELETFGVQFPLPLFERIAGDGADEPLKRFSARLRGEKAVLLSDRWGAIDPGLQQAIQQVLDCPYSGDLKRLFLFNKSLELLTLSASACARSEGLQDPFLKTRADKEKIIAARDLINECVEQPPHLADIARLVGINEYKLKRGFRETFHTTVFGYLAEQRLYLARRRLRDSAKTAAEISAELGYASPQHFSNAFKRKFGVTPQTARKNP